MFCIFRDKLNIHGGFVFCIFRDKLNILIESFYKEVEKLRDAAIQVLMHNYVIFIYNYY